MYTYISFHNRLNTYFIYECICQLRLSELLLNRSNNIETNCSLNKWIRFGFIFFSRFVVDVLKIFEIFEFEMKLRKLMFETEIVYLFSTTLIYTVFLKSRFDFDYIFFSVFLASVVSLINSFKKNCKFLPDGNTM